MGSRVRKRVLGFDEWLGEVESKRPEKVFVRTKGFKDIMVGEVYEHEPSFRDEGVEFYGYLPAQSRPYMIHEQLIKLGYAVYGFGEYGSKVIIHYRREGESKRLRVSQTNLILALDTHV